MPVSAIVVEDGTGLADANSWVDRATTIQYALDQGVTLADDSTTDVLLYKARAYLETFRYVGERATTTQRLSWPRKNAEIEDVAFPSDEIPQQIIDAQMQLAIYAQSTDLAPVVTGAFVTREKVGPIETEYASSVRTNGQPYFPLIDELLAPLLDFVDSFALTSVRV